MAQSCHRREVCVDGGGAKMIALALTIAPLPVTVVDGNELFRRCEPSSRSATCEAYVLGVTDMLVTLASAGASPQPTVCLGRDANGRQLADVVYDYLKVHPQARNLGGAALVAMAVQKAFPCPAGS